MIIIGVVIGMTLASGFAGGIIGVMIDRWRRESRQLDAEIESYERHTARHAKTQPRTSLVREEALPSLPPAQRPTSKSRQDQPSAWYLPPPGPIRSHTSAAQIAPVVLPDPYGNMLLPNIPGPGKPQAPRTSEPGTAMLPRYRSALDAAGVRPRLELPATTGEMKAVTDDYIAQMAIDEEQYRLGLAT